MKALGDCIHGTIPPLPVLKTTARPGYRRLRIEYPSLVPYLEEPHAPEPHNRGVHREIHGHILVNVHREIHGHHIRNAHREVRGHLILNVPREVATQATQGTAKNCAPHAATMRPESHHRQRMHEVRLCRGRQAARPKGQATPARGGAEHKS